jgi:hypothetical protein
MYEKRDRNRRGHEDKQENIGMGKKKTRKKKKKQEKLKG